MNKKIILALAVLSLAGIFCVSQPAASPTSTADVGAMVDATLTALAAPATAAAPTDTLAPTVPPASPTDTLSTTPMSSFPTGLITGAVNYPASAIPPERVVAWSTADGSYYSVDTVAGQTSYELGVPTGTYTVVAYSLGGSGFPTGLAAGYSQAVPCGLSVSCTDHTLIPVTVTSNATLTNINPQDWYAPDGTFPAMPTP
ncbi:MAG TPA: hypothetical protein VMC09_15925 [Anaerolineales bacterium]|nr:hypothetical protein [Anaerolineales bacterium]